MNTQVPASLMMALDFPAASPALRIAGKVRGIVPWVKVGLELFGAAGPRMDGVVCSGHEVRKIRQTTGLRCLTPGIRLSHAAQDDQRRIVSPAKAVRAGADYLVVGRPITAAPDPVRAAEEILRDMRKAYPKPSPHIPRGAA